MSLGRLDSPDGIDRAMGFGSRHGYQSSSAPGIGGRRRGSPSCSSFEKPISSDKPRSDTTQ